MKSYKIIALLIIFTSLIEIGLGRIKKAHLGGPEDKQDNPIDDTVKVIPENEKLYKAAIEDLYSHKYSSEIYPYVCPVSMKIYDKKYNTFPEIHRYFNVKEINLKQNKNYLKLIPNYIYECMARKDFNTGNFNQNKKPKNYKDLIEDEKAKVANIRNFRELWNILDGLRSREPMREFKVNLGENIDIDKAYNYHYTSSKAIYNGCFYAQYGKYIEGEEPEPEPEPEIVPHKTTSGKSKKEEPEPEPKFHCDLLINPTGHCCEDLKLCENREPEIKKIYEDDPEIIKKHELLIKKKNELIEKIKEVEQKNEIYQKEVDKYYLEFEKNERIKNEMNIKFEDIKRIYEEKEKRNHNCDETLKVKYTKEIINVKKNYKSYYDRISEILAVRGIKLGKQAKV